MMTLFRDYIIKGVRLSFLKYSIFLKVVLKDADRKTMIKNANVARLVQRCEV